MSTIPILNKEWRGVLALIWLFCGMAVEVAVERWTRDSVAREYLTSAWMVFGWLGPTLVLAISGIRKGNVASRVCGTLVLVAFAMTVAFLLCVGFVLRNR